MTTSAHPHRTMTTSSHHHQAFHHSIMITSSHPNDNAVTPSSSLHVYDMLTSTFTHLLLMCVHIEPRPILPLRVTRPASRLVPRPYHRHDLFYNGLLLQRPILQHPSPERLHSPSRHDTPTLQTAKRAWPAPRLDATIILFHSHHTSQPSPLHHTSIKLCPNTPFFAHPILLPTTTMSGPTTHTWT